MVRRVLVWGMAFWLAAMLVVLLIILSEMFAAAVLGRPPTEVG